MNHCRNYEEINGKKNYYLEYRAVLLKAKEILSNSAFFKYFPFSELRNPFPRSIGPQKGGFDEHKDFEKAGGPEEEDVKPITIGGVKINYLVGVISKEDCPRVINKLALRA